MTTIRPDRPPPKLTWFDRVLIGIAPRWGLRRVQARAAAFAYEAASPGRRTTGWHRSSSDANAAAGPALTSLRELSRDLRRNNGWARRGVQVITNNTVGWGIQPKPTGVRGARATAALDVWNEWAASTRCDHDGRLPFHGLQRLVMETIVESGEALIIRQPAAPKDGLPIPLRLQVLEPDYLSPIQNGVLTDSGGVIIQGIEFDSRGRRVAYWLYTRHPGSAVLGPTIKGAFSTQRIPAENVIHVYRVDRPGQVRGVPWLASAIARLNDFDDFEDAELMRAKIAACFAAFVQDIDGTGTGIGEQDPTEPTLETLEPGHIEYLPPGKSVTFAQPQGVVEGAFTTRTLRRIAVSLGVTYEDLTGDYSMVNFSSARMGRIAHSANVDDWRWNMIIPQLCDGVWKWAMELAAGLEGWQVVPTAEWAPPPMKMLEPDKEGLAYQRLVRTGAMTIPQMIRELGYDPEAHLTEIAETNKRLDELKIVLDSDPRHTNAQGAAQLGAGGGAPGAKPAADPKAKDASGDGTDAAGKPNGKTPHAEA